MRILVTGAQGLLGSALVTTLGAAHEIVATDRTDRDIADPAHDAILRDHLEARS